MKLLNDLSRTIPLVNHKLIKVVSVDLWGTIISENPRIKKKRFDILKDYYPNLNQWKCLFEYESLIEESKVSYGLVTPSHERLKRILSMYIDNKYHEEIIKKFDQLALEFLPESNHRLLTYMKLWSQMDLPLCILSNTGKTNSNTTLHILESLKIKELFSYIFLSESCNMGKPSKAFFDLISSHTGYPLESICHIGDSEYYDFYGALLSGFGYFCFEKIV